jgi:hypothetical protein
MKYMQNGGFQNHKFMRLTLYFTALFLLGLWITNFAMYFNRMGLTPDSVVAYYLGSEANFTRARTFGSMLEVTHVHLPIMGIVILMLTHLLIFAPFADRTKYTFIAGAFLSALINEGAGWLVRFVHPGFAPLKIVAFLSFQGILFFLLLTLAVFLRQASSKKRKKS